MHSPFDVNISRIDTSHNFNSDLLNKDLNKFHKDKPYLGSELNYGNYPWFHTQYNKAPNSNYPDHLYENDQIKKNNL